MTEGDVRDVHAAAGNAALVATLAAGNFAIGMGAFVVIGVLSPLAADLGMSTAAAGMVMTVYAIAYALMSPLLVSFTGGFDRRAVLVAALSLFLASALLSMLAPNAILLYAARVLGALGAGMFTPVAASVVFSASPPERRGRALANVFLGMTLAQAFGLPVGSFVGYTFGWQAAFAVVVLLTVPSLLLVIRHVPRGIAFQPTSLMTLAAALADWRSVVSVLVTASFTASAYILYTFVTPLFESSMGLGRNGIALILVFYGAGAVAGSWSAGLVTDRVGPVATLACVAIVQVAIMPFYSFLPLPFMALAILTFFWAMFGWSFMVPQQARLVRQTPHRQAVVLSLNAACIYVGASLGSAAGGIAVARLGLDWLGIVGGIAMALGVAHLFLSERLMAPRMAAHA